MRKNLIIILILCLSCLASIVIAESKYREEELVEWKELGHTDLSYAFALGNIYYDGNNDTFEVKQDYKEAYRWYWVAAHCKVREYEGHTVMSDYEIIGEAEVQIAKMSYHGVGTEVNYRIAYLYASNGLLNLLKTDCYRSFKLTKSYKCL